MLQQETIVHHEHVTVMPESRTATLRPECSRISP